MNLAFRRDMISNEWMRLAFLGIVLESGCAVAPLEDEGLVSKDVFGADDRREVSDPANDPSAVMWAQSTAVMTDRGNLTDDGPGFSRLALPTLGQDLMLCSDEPFADQPGAGHCSASFVKDDLVLTAGHCVERPGDCERFAFVFGFMEDGSGRDLLRVANTDVYGCREIVGIENGSRDWAIVRLDRPVEGRAALPVREREVAVGDALTLIGYPLGAPAKIDAGGVVIASGPGSPTFRTTFDAYGGNSGSAIFDSVTGEIVGVHVAGGPDFVTDEVTHCQRSLFCAAIGPPSCEGSIETHASLFASLARLPSADPPSADPPGDDGSYPTTPSPPEVNDIFRPMGNASFDFEAILTGFGAYEGAAITAAVLTSDDLYNHHDVWASGTRYVRGGRVTFSWPNLLNGLPMVFRFYVDENANRRCDRHQEFAYAIRQNDFRPDDVHLEVDASDPLEFDWIADWSCDKFAMPTG